MGVWTASLRKTHAVWSADGIVSAKSAAGRALFVRALSAVQRLFDPLKPPTSLLTRPTITYQSGLSQNLKESSSYVLRPSGSFIQFPVGVATTRPAPLRSFCKPSTAFPQDLLSISHSRFILY